MAVSVRRSRLELKSPLSQDRVHANNRAHHVQRIRDTQKFCSARAPDQDRSTHARDGGPQTLGKFGRSREQLDAGQASLLDETIDADIAAIEQELQDLAPAAKTEAESRQQPKRAALPAELPRVQVHHVLNNCSSRHDTAPALWQAWFKCQKGL